MPGSSPPQPELTSTPKSSWLITIAASAGGIEALRTLLAALPQDLPAAVVIVQHRPAAHEESYLDKIFARVTTLPVMMADENQLIRPNTIYVARSNLHLTVSPEKRFSYVDGTRIRFVLSSANPLFASAAAAFENRLIAVVLTGGGSDASDGVQTVKAHGGLVIVQDPRTARHASMPQSAVKTGAVDYVLPLEAIAPALTAIIRDEPVQGAR
jgi:two-component system, chemotaxis family, protein-glutamate methylesterase/glutaminase